MYTLPSFMATLSPGSATMRPIPVPESLRKAYASPRFGMERCMESLSKSTTSPG